MLNDNNNNKQHPSYSSFSANGSRRGNKHVRTRASQRRRGICATAEGSMDPGQHKRPTWLW